MSVGWTPTRENKGSIGSQLVSGLRYGHIYRLLNTAQTAFRLARRYPVASPLRDAPSCLFVIGSGRSGNTLLRAMLVAQGDIAIPPESYVLPEIIHDYYRFSFLPWRLLVRQVLSPFQFDSRVADSWHMEVRQVCERAYEIPDNQRSLAAILDLLYRSYAEQYQPLSTRWGDKTPLNTLHLPEINLTFPQAQYIHLLRDGRDVTASYLKAGRYDSVADAAARWQTSVQLAREFGAKLDAGHFLEIRYEMLVTQSEPNLRNICRFLGIEYRESMLAHWQHTDQLGDTDQAHHANVHNPVSRDSIGNWQRHLSLAQQEEVQTLLGDELRSLGY